MIRYILASAIAMVAWAASAGITYPVDVAATQGRWVVRDTATGVVAWPRRSWPRPDGAPIEGLEPTAEWLLVVRTEPASLDSRLQSYACADPVIDSEAATITVACSAPARPVADIRAAVANMAAARVAEAKRRLGWPADYIDRMVGLLGARQAGQILAADQAATLDAYLAASVAYIDAPARVAADLGDWAEAHPGQVPDTAEPVWPPLPPDPITGSTEMPHTGDDI